MSILIEIDERATLTILFLEQLRQNLPQTLQQCAFQKKISNNLKKGLNETMKKLNGKRRNTREEMGYKLIQVMLLQLREVNGSCVFNPKVGRGERRRRLEEITGT